MANNQTNRRKRDIKTKLMAAVCMLLVSSVMMVSSTYAWFTLSTAPEVKGITTAVGANGNLEMALLPKDGNMPANSTTGDGTLDLEARNVTWGNLVDLSDSTIYGLDQITLFPAELNLTASNTLAEAFLKTPAYGADGRVSELLENTVTGYYDPADGFVPNDYYGVRAVGTASGMTPRQLDYRNARSAGNNATAYAKTLASQSLSNNGSALANIAMAHGLAKEGTTESYTQTDVAALKAIVSDLETKILPKIEEAYLQYILAYAASAAGGTTDATWTAVKSAVNEDGATLSSVTNAMGTLPSELSTAIGKYNTTKSTVTAASVELAGLATEENATFTWEQIRSPMGKLVDTDTMKINGYTIAEIMEDNNRLVSSVLGGNGLELTMVTGAGVYADIADQCGDFTASIMIDKVEYGGLALEDVTARMATKTTVTPAVYLAAISAAVDAAKAPAGGAAASSLPITDMYGYIIDLAFRTNAADSDLLLQVEPEDRIYSDNTNDDTMGGGSSMTFKATTTDFTDAQVKELMKAIRIVFFNPKSRQVIANAKLLADAATLTADGWEAKMYMVDDNGAKKNDDTIMPLTQNTSTALSMLVYLDGNLVGNDDVAATAASSMTGKMNIQFASSANLVPMEYAALHQGTGNNNNSGSNNSGTGDVSEPDEPAVTP